jgi:hypothetical protein
MSHARRRWAVSPSQFLAKGTFRIGEILSRGDAGGVHRGKLRDREGVRIVSLFPGGRGGGREPIYGSVVLYAEDETVEVVGIYRL